MPAPSGHVRPAGTRAGSARHGVVPAQYGEPTIEEEGRPMSAEQTLALLLAAVAVVVVVHWIADRFGLPAAALLTLVGIAYALLPGPNIGLNPHLVLTFVIPPLLYSAALGSSLIAIRRNLRTVISLSVVLVLLTALLVGVGFALVVPGATLAVGVALGAAVSPPDPVAALAVGRRVNLPPNLITLIQGEGLLNDATALTTLTVAVAAATGGGFSLAGAAGQFLLTAAGGLVVGVLAALLVRVLRPIAVDPLTSNAISLATPFVAYLAAETVDVSGVLAVVVAGLIVGHASPRLSTGANRLQTTAVWRLIDFLLEGVVFLLIGQQLPTVIRGLGQYPVGTVVAASALSVAVVLLLRPGWLLLTQLLPTSLHTRLGDEGTGVIQPEEASDASATARAEQLTHQQHHGGGRRLDGREIAALSWSGTRGVISLAAIFTIPLVTDSGHPFPARDLMLFCTFVVVLVTLVGQGLTFAPLVGMLGLRAKVSDMARLRNSARLAATDAGLAHLHEMRDAHPDEQEIDAIGRIGAQLKARAAMYRRRLEMLENAEPDELPTSPEREAGVRVRRAVIAVEREELLRWRDSGRLPDESLRVLEGELDREEGLLAGPARH